MVQLSPALPTGFEVFPSDNIWNVPIDTAPLHPLNAQWMDIINGHTGHNLHPDFGSMYAGHWNGIPYNLATSTTPLVKVVFDAGAYVSESDPLPVAGLPIPVGAIVEGDPPTGTGDRHLLIVDMDNKILHELATAVLQPDGSYTCHQYSRWDLTSDALRPDGWTSTDAAGLPIFPLLIRKDEIMTGVINHALRFTLSLTYKPHLWPARHDAVSGSALNPPFGMRVRMKSGFDITPYSPTNQIILKTLKKYGMFLADNGGDWFISGAPDLTFDDSDLHLLTQIIPNTAFEVVDTSSWMVNIDSAQSNSVPPATPPPPPPPPTPPPTVPYSFTIPGSKFSIVYTP